MSVEAITWALKQPISQSSAKFVLVVLANAAAGDTGLAFPSSKYLAEATGQDRKTVLANLRRLQDMGYIEDTGKRRGETNQVVVYRLNPGENSAENGTVKECQKRNGSENGTVPKTDGNSTVFPSEQSRFSAKQSQKRDTEPSEPSGNRKSNQKGASKPAPQIDVTLPAWLDRALWDSWVADRKERRKPLTQRAAELSIGELTKLRAEGFTPEEVIETAIRNGWQGLFAPKRTIGGNHADRAGTKPGSVGDAVQRAIDEREARERGAGSVFEAAHAAAAAR
jgi:hypothetical protein